jgi:hypothetical protein
MGHHVVPAAGVSKDITGAVNPPFVAAACMAKKAILLTYRRRLVFQLFYCCGDPAWGKCAMRSPAAQEVIQKIWSSAILTFGLMLSVAWTFLLGYGLSKILELAI